MSITYIFFFITISTLFQHLTYSNLNICTALQTTSSKKTFRTVNFSTPFLSHLSIKISCFLRALKIYKQGFERVSMRVTLNGKNTTTQRYTVVFNLKDDRFKNIFKYKRFAFRSTDTGLLIRQLKAKELPMTTESLCKADIKGNFSRVNIPCSYIKKFNITVETNFIDISEDGFIKFKQVA